MATNDFTGSSTVLETEDEVPLGAARLSPCAPKWWGLSEDQNSTSLQLSSTFEAFRARVSTYGGILWSSYIDSENASTIGHMLCDLAYEASTFLELWHAWHAEQSTIAQADATSPTGDVDRVRLGCRFRKAAIEFLPGRRQSGWPVERQSSWPVGRG